MALDQNQYFQCPNCHRFLRFGQEHECEGPKSWSVVVPVPGNVTVPLESPFKPSPPIPRATFQEEPMWKQISILAERVNDLEVRVRKLEVKNGTD